MLLRLSLGELHQARFVTMDLGVRRAPRALGDEVQQIHDEDEVTSSAAI